MLVPKFAGSEIENIIFWRTSRLLLTVNPSKKRSGNGSPNHDDKGGSLSKSSKIQCFEFATFWKLVFESLTDKSML